MSFDNSVVVLVNGGMHVDWSLLTTAEQDELTANYPRVVAGVQVTDTTSPQFQAWLDTAYLARHIFDDLNASPFG